MSTVETRALTGRLPHCVRLAALAPAAAGPAGLDPAELALVPTGDAQRAHEFIAGRVAARTCLSALGAPDAPLLARPDGSPAWPTSIRGSISHKPHLCVAVAGSDCDVSGLGIDLEPTTSLPDVVWPTVLTPGEVARHCGSGGLLDPRVSRLAFTAKEAYYKWSRSSGHTGALDFKDVEVDVEGDTLLFSSSCSAPKGVYIIGRAWTLAAVWTPA